MTHGATEAVEIWVHGLEVDFVAVQAAERASRGGIGIRVVCGSICVGVGERAHGVVGGVGASSGGGDGWGHGRERRGRRGRVERRGRICTILATIGSVGVEHGGGGVGCVMARGASRGRFGRQSKALVAV
jgi:hypothetical protein